MSIEIRQVVGQERIREFIRFPYRLYKGSPYWVPPMDKGELMTLDPASNPAQKASPAMLYMAYRDDVPVGRLAAIAMQGREGVEGRFGWYDVIDDLSVSKALFDTAMAWLRERGATQIKGPMGFTNLDKAGMLTFGFNELATISTIYNHPYYNDHVCFLGFSKSVDYVEYEFKVPASIPEKVTAFVDVVAKRYDVRLLENLSKGDMQNYGDQLFELINETHRNLYGFKLLSEEMKQYYIRKYLSYIKPEFVVLIVNSENRLVAYALSMPSFATAFQKAQGRLFPMGFWYIFNAARKMNRVDLLLIGVTDALRNKGITALIFNQLIKTYQRYGVRYVESNPELEDNQQVQALWQKYEYRHHKRRRVYQRDL